MKITRSITALLSAAAIALSCAGCSDISKMGTVDGKEIPAGLYLWFENDAVTEARTEIENQLSDAGQETSDISNFSYFDYNVQDVPFSQYVTDRTVQFLKRYAAVLNLTEKYELLLTDEEAAEINKNANDMWNTEMTYYGYSLGQTYGEFYENMGIGKQSYKLYMNYEKLSDKLFDKHYEDGGLTPTDESDIKTYYNDNYGRFGVISISTADAADDDAKAEYKKLAEKYLNEIKSGKDYGEVLHEYEEYKEEKEKEEEEADDASSDDASSSVDESGSSDESSLTEDSSTESEDDEEEEEEDHDQLLAKGSDDSDKYNKFLFDLKTGESGIYEDESVTYVVIRLDLLEREDWFDLYRSDILHIMMDDEFGEMLDETAKDYVVDFRKASLDAYKPEVVLNR